LRLPAKWTLEQADARYNEAWDKLDALESGRDAAQAQSGDAGGADAEKTAGAEREAPEKEHIAPWIMAASADLSLSNDAQLAGARLFEEFDRLDWWHDYSDDYTVRVRERERMGEANKDLAAYAMTSPDHAVLASRIFEKTAPPEFSRPRADWYVPTDELGMIETEERASEIVARPLSAAERNERVRRIIENPYLEGAERVDGVLQALAEQREELGLAEPARQDDAPQVEYSQEPELQSSADRDAAEIDYLFGREEMTEARAAAYDRSPARSLARAPAKPPARCKRRVNRNRTQEAGRDDAALAACRGDR
jgi:hypothetical protein